MTMVTMVAASVSDWRNRMASDVYWYIMGLGGSVLLGIELLEDGARWSFLLCLALVTLVFVDLLRDRPGIFEDGLNIPPLLLYVATLASYAYLSLEHFGEKDYWTVMTIPLLMVLFFVLYQLDVVKGGADAKALIALSFVFPVYPELQGLPLLELNEPAAFTILPFPVLVLFNGAVLTMLVPLWMLVRNLARGDLRFPLMLLGTRMPLDEARRKHVWPMERVVDGRVRTVLFPRSDEEPDWDSLLGAGVDRPWVTPKVPFLIPLAVAIPFSLVVGNVLFYALGV